MSSLAKDIINEENLAAAKKKAADEAAAAKILSADELAYQKLFGSSAGFEKWSKDANENKSKSSKANEEKVLQAFHSPFPPPSLGVITSILCTLTPLLRPRRLSWQPSRRLRRKPRRNRR